MYLLIRNGNFLEKERGGPPLSEDVLVQLIVTTTQSERESLRSSLRGEAREGEGVHNLPA